MKTTLAFMFGLSLTLGALSAQDCQKSCDIQQGCTAKTELTSVQGCCEQSNPMLAQFQKLAPEKQQAVREALATLTKTCPVGSRMPRTVMALDKLYTESLGTLKLVASNDKEPEGLRADLASDVAMLTQARNLNNQLVLFLQATGVVNAECCKGLPAAECCKNAKGEKAEGCGEAKTEGCSGDKAAGCSGDKAEGGCSGEGEGGCTMSFVNDVQKSWGEFPADMEKAKACEATSATMKAAMATLHDNGVEFQPMIDAMTNQAQILSKGIAHLACPKSGLMAKHADVMKACEWTNENCTKSVNATVAAYKLLRATPFGGAKAKAKAKAEKAECSGECTSVTGECSGECSGEAKKAAKSDCCGEKSKAECSGECSGEAKKAAKSDCCGEKAPAKKAECCGDKK